MSVSQIIKDIGLLFQRLFNHTGVLDNEIQYFCSEFENSKRSDFELLLQTLQNVNESKDVSTANLPTSQVIDTISSNLNAVSMSIEQITRYETPNSYINACIADQHGELDKLHEDIESKKLLVDQEYDERLQSLKTEFEEMEQRYMLEQE